MRTWRTTILAAAVFAVCLSEGRVRACMMASHTFSVLLGWLEGRPVYVEVELRRLDIDRGPRPRGGYQLFWQGSARTLVGGIPALHPGMPTWHGKIGDRKLAAQIARWFKTGVSRFGREPKFVAAGMPEYRYCDFLRACGDVRLQSQDDGSLVLVIGPTGKQRATLALPAGYVAALTEDVDLDARGAKSESSPRSPEPKDIARLKLAADTPVISRVLSYAAPGGAGALVVDLAYGDDTHGPDVEEAVWPPCGCKALNECVPRAPTLHHGSHLEVVVAIGEHHPLGRPAVAVELRAPSEAELRGAESLPGVAIRADGVYATDPLCDGKTWERRQLLLFGDGHFEYLRGNVSTASAAHMMGREHFVFPLGNYQVRGRRVVGTLKEDGRRGDALTFDGIIEEGAIWAGVRKAREKDAIGVRFRFAAVESAKKEPLTHKHE